VFDVHSLLSSVASFVSAAETRRERQTKIAITLIPGEIWTDRLCFMKNPGTLAWIVEVTSIKESSFMSTTSGAGAIPDPNIDIAKPQSKSLLASLLNHPTGFWFIFWGEFAERCSYYGMRAILVSYMMDRLGMEPGPAGSYAFMFFAGCYFLPLVGGFVADNYLGKFKTIVFFSLPYILGHVVLGFENVYCLFTALALLAMGSGVIKPNISTLMGLTYDQERPGDEELRTTAFSLFYVAINIGAALSQIAIPWIRTNYGYQIAFLFPAILMALAFLIFASGKRFYAVEIISQARSTPEESALKWQVLSRIGSLFLLVTFFWSIFDQSAATWIIFGRLYQDSSMFGWHVDVEQVQATNAILIVLLTPLFAALWAVLRNKGMPVSATNKIIAGFLLTSLCLVIMAYPAYKAGPLETLGVPLGAVESQQEAKDKVNKAVPPIYAGLIGSMGNPMMSPPLAAGDVGAPMQSTQVFVRPENKVTIWWQVLAFVILTIAEILISITGLELAFVAAPKSMKGFVTSLWLLTVFLANVFNTPLAHLYPVINPGLYFAMLAGLLVLVAAAFYFVAQRFNRLVSQQEEAERALRKV
jgi:dipeptide/tripeptide permease